MIREKELVAVCTTTVARYPLRVVDDVDYIGMVRTAAVVFNATDVIALIRPCYLLQLIARREPYERMLKEKMLSSKKCWAGKNKIAKSLQHR